MSALYPLLLSPVYKSYIWGGSKISEFFYRKSCEKVISESWELSDRDEGMCNILNGKYRDKSLKDVLFAHKDDLDLNGSFPLLIKLIDACSALSIQVHPNDQSALALNSEAKSEMWYIIDAEPKSHIYLGFNKPMSNESILKAIQSKNLENDLNAIEVCAGQAYYIPGGMVHSIGKGCLIYEVQQNSNTTYRLYDWGRVNKDGEARELHLDKAIQVLNLNKSNIKPLDGKFEKHLNYQKNQLLNCPYFNFSKYSLYKNMELLTSKNSRVYFMLKGSAEIS